MSADVKLIYLAIPYSHPEIAVREKRFRIANRVAVQLMNMGHVVFSPISHSHPLAVVGKLPMDWDYWAKVDERFLRACDSLLVVKLDGWKESRGVNEELRLAREMGKPIDYYEVDEKEILK